MRLISEQDFRRGLEWELDYALINRAPTLIQTNDRHIYVLIPCKKFCSRAALELAERKNPMLALDITPQQRALVWMISSKYDAELRILNST